MVDGKLEQHSEIKGVLQSILFSVVDAMRNVEHGKYYDTLDKVHDISKLTDEVDEMLDTELEVSLDDE